jgi:hypothetical protein
VQAQTLDGRSVNLNSLKGQWLLVSTSAGDCGQRCQEHLYLQRQLRETLGREKTGWTGSGSSTTSSPCLKKSCLLPSKPHGACARCSHRQLAQARGRACAGRASVCGRSARPLDDALSRKHGQAAAGKAKRDLERLLRASASWDEAGELRPMQQRNRC